MLNELEQTSRMGLKERVEPNLDGGSEMGVKKQKVYREPVRVSTRLQFKEKLKALTENERYLELSEKCKTSENLKEKYRNAARFVDMTNTKHKCLFLQMLGLEPRNTDDLSTSLKCIEKSAKFKIDEKRRIEKEEEHLKLIANDLKNEIKKQNETVPTDTQEITHDETSNGSHTSESGYESSSTSPNKVGAHEKLSSVKGKSSSSAQPTQQLRSRAVLKVKKLVEVRKRPNPYDTSEYLTTPWRVQCPPPVIKKTRFDIPVDGSCTPEDEDKSFWGNGIPIDVFFQNSFNTSERALKSKQQKPESLQSMIRRLKSYQTDVYVLN